jgi:alpha-D-ribose 1-methylphosphonate 5-phosphate C-P lyase
MNAPTYNFAYLDEQTKRMIRRAILKAIAIPGYQVPFASREMPMPYGWGTGGVQITASIIGPEDVLKVIDQGADDTTNAVSIRAFFQKVANVAVTTHTKDATIIQTRHRIPEQKLGENQVLVYQVPISKTYAYPVKVDGRYVMDPSPTPKFDNPKMHMSDALQLFGAGREKRIYAVPPYTDVVSLDFEDYPFEVQTFEQDCALCGAHGVYLDEVVLDDKGGRMFVCSDTDHCEDRREHGHVGAMLAPNQEAAE